jgi:D-serine deaminase-like pyridoxal phosphate-dependent protein
MRADSLLPAADSPLHTLAGDLAALPYKGFAPTVGNRPVAALAAAGTALTEAGFTFPLLTLQRTAVEHNIAAMARYCREHGVQLAPHGKSTMSPELHALQLKAGAWALTAATIHEVAVYRAFGVRRILLANELVDGQAVRWLTDELAGCPDFEFSCFADSLAGVELLAKSAGDTAGAGRIGVLIEVGYQGGRAGCRTLDEVLAVARAVKATPALRLVGVAGYEGLFGRDHTPATAARVTSYVGFLRAAAEAVRDAGLAAAGPDFVVSCGGSAFFDIVTAELTAGWPRRDGATVVLRCGSYLTHDDGMYEHASPFARDESLGGPLRPALHVWAHVLSVPEPGWAIIGAGRRDVPYDAGLPRPMLVWRPRASRPEILTGTSTVKVNDQHAYLQSEPAEPVAVGDLIGFGISHPCSAFDKWRLIPVLDDQWRVVDTVRTYF